MNQSKYVKNLSDKITCNESSFKSIISDIRNSLPRRGHILIKNGLKYAEESKKLTRN